MTRVWAFGLLFALLATGVGARAQTATELQAEISKHNEQIKALQAEIANYQKQAEALAKQKDTLQSTVDTLTLSQKQLAAQIGVTNARIDSANIELKQLGVAIGDKEATIAGDQTAIAKALREVAQGDARPLVTQILAADSFVDAWQAAEEVSQFNRALGEHIEELKVAREELAENRDAVAATKEKLENLQKDLTLQKKQVDLNKAAQQRLLTDTKNQEGAYQRLISEKKAEEAAFEAALFDLASQLEYVLDPTKIPPAGKGVLRWPLDKVSVTQEFGRTSSSGRLYTSGTHDGIDMRTKWPEYPTGIGMPVRAAGSGTVMEINQGAAPNCQYGKWVLIRHPNGLATLYAHLSEISVQKGGRVIIGQVIGYSGNTGYATGPHLHLSVLFADAVVFKQHICKSGRAVTIPVAPVNTYLNPLSYL